MQQPINRRQFIKSASAAATSLAALSLVTDPLDASPVRRAGTVPAPRVLVEALKSDDLVIKADAARLLGELRAPAAVEPLVDYVRTDRHYSKTAGFEALMKLGDRSVVGQIQPLVDQPGVHSDAYWYGCMSVRLSAALALLALGSESGKGLLLGEWKGEGFRDWPLYTWFGPTVMRLPDTLETTRQLKATFTIEKLLPKVKTDPGQLIVITDTLGLIGGDEATAKLEQMLDHRSRYVRARAAANLMRLSSFNGHVRKVVKLAEADPTLFVRVKASQALVEKDYHEHLSQIVTAAEFAAHPFDQATAVEALGQLATEEYEGIIAQALKSEYPYTRLCAVEALERLGSRSAAVIARRSAEDPNQRVRLQVAKCCAVRFGMG